MKENKNNRMAEIAQLISVMSGMQGLVNEPRANELNNAYKEWIMSDTNPANQRYAAETQGQRLQNAGLASAQQDIFAPLDPMSPPETQLREQAMFRQWLAMLGGSPFNPMQQFTSNMQNLPR